MSKLKKLTILIFILSLLNESKILASANSTDMISLPSTTLKYTAPLEYGLGMLFGEKENSIFYEPECFVRLNFLKKVILNTNLSGKYIKQGIHIDLLTHATLASPYTHHLGAGIKNGGWYPETDDLENTVIGSYISYALSYETIIFHLGLAQNKNINQEETLFLFGIEHLTEFGNVVFEWDGKTANFGFSLMLNKKNKAYLSFMPNKNKDSLKRKQVFTVGYSWLSDDVFQISNNISNSTQTNSDVNFAQGSKSADQIQDALIRMERGMDLYFKKYYSLAKIELEKVSEIFPTPTVYSRLGSISYKLKEIDNAINYWKKALSLDPGNEEVKKLIEYVKQTRDLKNVE